MLTIKNYNKLDGYVGENFYITKVEEYGYDYLFLMDTWGGKYKVGFKIHRIPIDNSTKHDIYKPDKYYECQIGNKQLKCEPFLINENSIKDLSLFSRIIQGSVRNWELNRKYKIPEPIKPVEEIKPKPKMNIFQRLKSRWTMKKTGNSFYDNIGGNVVYQWQDCYGDVWSAEWRWGLRVKINEN